MFQQLMKKDKITFCVLFDVCSCCFCHLWHISLWQKNFSDTAFWQNLNCLNISVVNEQQQNTFCLLFEIYRGCFVFAVYYNFYWDKKFSDTIFTVSKLMKYFSISWTLVKLQSLYRLRYIKVFFTEFRNI